MLENLKKAAKIAKDVVRYSKSLLKPEVSLLEIAESVEQKIRDLGGEPAFPVNISINEIAAHYTPQPGNDKVLKDGDVVKIDFGVHIDGYIVDVAYTEEINDTRYKDLIEASKQALLNVKKIIRKEIELWEIGKIIENTIKQYGFIPIYNLSGHKIDKYLLHTGLNIPNYNNGSKIKLKEGIYAIEPFATTGIGYVKDGPGSKIYSIINYRPLRELKLRKFLDILYSKYKNLPFAYRWLLPDASININIDFAIEILKKNKIIYEYPILIEKSKGIVSQHETTFFINNGIHDLMDVD